jgi:hypothetical protein
MHALAGGGPGRRHGKVDLKVLLGCGAGVLIVLLLLCAGAGVGGWWWYTTEEAKKATEAEHRRILDALGPEVPSYLDTKNRTPGVGKFKGKVVCIDTKAKQIDEESLDHLPEALKATKPDEVGGIVLLTWSEEEGGTYPDGSRAMISVARVTLIDRARSKVLFSGQEILGETPQQKVGTGDRTGPKPWDKLTDLLKQYQESG